MRFETRLALSQRRNFLCQIAPQLGPGEVPVPAVHRLDPRAIDRDQLPAEQFQAPAHLHEVTEHLPERLPVLAPEIRNGLEVRPQAAQQPDHLQVAVGFRLQPSAGPDPVQIPVDVQLQQVGGIVPRAPCLFRLRSFEPGPSQVETVDESVDEPHWVVGTHIVVYRVRQ